MPNIIADIFSGGAEGILKGIGSLAKDVRSAITGEISPEKKAEIEQKLMELEFVAQKAQTDINIEEAKNPNIFVSGWRPFIGWVCGLALAYTFVGYSLIEWGLTIAGSSIKPPVLHTDYLFELVMAMLGMGGLRTFEKVKGVTR